jgi:hypothetical protein
MGMIKCECSCGIQKVESFAPHVIVRGIWVYPNPCLWFVAHKMLDYATIPQWPLSQYRIDQDRSLTNDDPFQPRPIT